MLPCRKEWVLLTILSAPYASLATTLLHFRYPRKKKTGLL